MNISKYLLFLILLFNIPNLYAAQVNTDVAQAINNTGSAYVIINLEVNFDFEPTDEQIQQTRRLRSLKAIEPRPELSKTEKLQRINQAVTAVQEEVLFALQHLDTNQFQLTTQYGYIAALVADIGQEALAILRQQPKVTLIQLSPQGQASLSTSVPLLNVDDVHSLSPSSYSGDGISIAVLDSGIDTDHSDFSDGAIIDEKCFVNAGCQPSNADESNSAEDDYGHGTHVSGIITSPDGIAPDSDIVAVKVIDGSGFFQLSDLMSGVDWIVENLDSISPDIRVINMSLGLTDRYSDVNECNSAYPSYTETFNQLANEFDVITFAASGNNSEASNIDWPSCLTDVIAVGNSNSGDTLHSTGNRGDLLEIVAPGVSIVSTEMDGTTKADTGTSMSSPMAVGIAALLLEKDDTLSAALIKQKFIDTGVDIIDNSITYKRVDALAAIQDETAQALLQLTQDSSPYLNGETYDLGVLSQGADISEQFKLFNLGNEVLVTSDFSLTGDTIGIEDFFPSGIASNSAETFTLNIPTDTEGSYSGSINFDSNDSNNSSFITTLEWLVCDGELPVSSDFDDPTGCWSATVLYNPDYETPLASPNDFIDDADLIKLVNKASEISFQFESSLIVNYTYSFAQAQLTTSAFSTTAYENVSLDFDFYERNGSGDDDKMKVQWSTDGEDWQDIDDGEFNCQTSSSAGWKQKNLIFPEEAENESTIYLNFLFEADGNNATTGKDCFLANLDITADSVPEIALYGNNIEITSPDTTPDTSDDTDFGGVEIGNTLSTTFSIANEGLADLNLTNSPYVTLSGDNADQFSITQPSNSVIAASSTQTFTVTFSPTAEGEQNATLTIKSDDNDEGTYIVLIKGEGTVEPVLTLSVAETEFFEDDGSDVATGTISRLGTDGAITITLSIDNDKVSISPSSLTIADSETESDEFTLSMIDDDEYTGNVTVVLTAAAADYEADTISLTVLEDDSKPVVVVEEEDTFTLPPPQPDYVAVFIGSPNGRVISDPEGIDCNKGQGSCWHIFPRIDPETGVTTRLTLNTIAPEGLYFDSWTGDSDCNDSKLYLNDTKGCLAYFYGIPNYQAPDVEQQAYFSNIDFTAVINESNNILSRFDLTDKQTILITATANDEQADPALSLEQTNTERLIAQNDNWAQALNHIALEDIILPIADNSAALLQYLDADYYSLAMTAIQSGLATLAITPQNDKPSLSYISTRLLFTDVDNTKVRFTLKHVSNTQPVLIKVWGTTSDLDPSVELRFGNRVLASNDNWQDNSQANEIPNNEQPNGVNDAALLVDLANADYELNLNTAGNINGLLVVEIQLLDNE
ncbi:S8 family serine peptidase [Candidatus Albibeggiatoa sp. nov. BB20]|uniref:S8 family serine peptidase n=1 Tax=Candidatus Albibeggiatoa sp. nov. BB20 TaxID=3162723 RepID=UPI00336534EE